LKFSKAQVSIKELHENAHVIFTTCKGWVSMKEPKMSGFQGQVVKKSN
jgi:hypothetical protein